MPSNIRGIPLVGIQEGMIDPKLFWWWVMERFPVWFPLRLPRWAAGTACTGLSHAYDVYCVASEGYRRDFIERGAPAGKLIVTGLPNIRDIERAFGDGVKRVHASELASRSKLRRVASHAS